jgi:SAM-dependent methyltransferase
MEGHRSAPPLDESLYDLRPQDAAFFKEITGIEDDTALKQHILDIQAKAYKIAPYGCIYLFVFTRHRLSALPAYQQVLRLGRECKNPIFLDIGCCFGNDIREAVLDGFPAAQTIGCDLRPELWNLGHELFKSSSNTFPAHFVGGDAFDPEVLAVVPPASMQTFTQHHSSTCSKKISNCTWPVLSLVYYPLSQAPSFSERTRVLKRRVL